MEFAGFIRSGEMINLFVGSNQARLEIKWDTSARIRLKFITKVIAVALPVAGDPRKGKN